MMTLKPLKVGKLTGSIYDFPEVGDVLPMHEHDETNVHITIVARGVFKMHGNGWEKISHAGEVLDWKPHDPHEFIAIEPNSRLVNIIKEM